MVLRGVSSEEPRKAGHASKWWRLCHYLDTRQEEGAWQVTTDTNNQRDQMWTITRYSFGRTQVSRDELLKQQHTPTLRSTEGQHPRRKVSDTQCCGSSYTSSSSPGQHTGLGIHWLFSTSSADILLHRVVLISQTFWKRLWTARGPNMTLSQ